MYRKISITLVLLALFAVSASAADFGAHVGYFGNEVKRAFVGADLMVPVGSMVSFAPNIDYTKISDAGLWWANIDVALRFPTTGAASWWVGAGPTWYYVTGVSGSSSGYGNPGIVRSAAMLRS